MFTATAELTFRAPWVHSLKEKRMLVRPMVDTIRHKYPVAIAEVGEQDVHQLIVIGVAAVSGQATQAQTVLDDVIRTMEGLTEAELIRADTALI